MKVYIRGNPATKGEDAPEGLPAGAAVRDARRARTSRGSTWPTPSRAKDNPLTARVIVNRVWAWHFGRGLVDTPSNFGALGERPSHPELLDWLAVNFVENGWSLKWLHREIVLSASTSWIAEPDAANDKTDAENVYLWRANRRRLDVEAWRDALLAVSGNLDPTPRRADVRPEGREREAPHGLREGQPARTRRPAAAVRLPRRERHRRQADGDDRPAAAAVRAQQRVHGEPGAGRSRPAWRSSATTDAERDRPPRTGSPSAARRRPRELELAERFLQLPPKSDDKLTRWEQYAQVLLASNEFMYVD